MTKAQLGAVDQVQNKLSIFNTEHVASNGNNFFFIKIGLVGN